MTSATQPSYEQSRGENRLSMHREDDHTLGQLPQRDKGGAVVAPALATVLTCRRSGAWKRKVFRPDLSLQNPACRLAVGMGVAWAQGFKRTTCDSAFPPFPEYTGYRQRGWKLYLEALLRNWCINTPTLGPLLMVILDRLGGSGHPCSILVA